MYELLCHLFRVGDRFDFGLPDAMTCDVDMNRKSGSEATRFSPLHITLLPLPIPYHNTRNRCNCTDEQPSRRLDTYLGRFPPLPDMSKVKPKGKLETT